MFNKPPVGTYTNIFPLCVRNALSFQIFRPNVCLSAMCMWITSRYLIQKREITFAFCTSSISPHFGCARVFVCVCVFVEAAHLYYNAATLISMRLFIATMSIFVEATMTTSDPIHEFCSQLVRCNRVNVQWCAYRFWFFSIRIRSAAWILCNGIDFDCIMSWSMCWIRRCCSWKMHLILYDHNWTMTKVIAQYNTK